MEENMVTIENETIDIGEPIEGDFEFSERPNYGLIGAVCALVAGGVAAIIYKNRHKIEEGQVNRLRKRGYEVRKIEDIKASIESDSEVEETEE